MKNSMKSMKWQKYRYNVSTKWLFTENRGYRFYGFKWRFDKFRQVSTKFDKCAYPRFYLKGQKTDTLYLRKDANTNFMEFFPI